MNAQRTDQTLKISKVAKRIIYDISYLILIQKVAFTFICNTDIIGVCLPFQNKKQKCFLDRTVKISKVAQRITYDISCLILIQKVVFTLICSIDIIGICLPFQKNNSIFQIDLTINAQNVHLNITKIIIYSHTTLDYRNN